MWDLSQGPSSPSRDGAGPMSSFPASAFGVQGLGFRVSGLRLRVSGFGFRVWGFGFWVSSFGSRAFTHPWHDTSPLNHLGGKVDPGQLVVQKQNSFPRVWGFISQKVLITLFCKSRFPHTSVNLSFVITNVQNKLTDLRGN